jgi:hypothetical protein
MEVTLHVAPELEPVPCHVVIAWARSIAPVVPSNALPPPLQTRVSALCQGRTQWPDGRRAAVRDMLRYGRYRPSGRAKPASEFLLGAALKGEFPPVNGPVDVNNVFSVSTGFPCSVFDGEKVGTELLLRRGMPGEAYLFNAAGHEINLEDLLLVCRRVEGGWEPCGNPVKDSMATKVGDATRSVVAVVFVPRTEPAAVAQDAAGRYAEWLEAFCGATGCGSAVVTG